MDPYDDPYLVGISSSCPRSGSPRLPSTRPAARYGDVVLWLLLGLAAFFFLGLVAWAIFGDGEDSKDAGAATLLLAGIVASSASPKEDDSTVTDSPTVTDLSESSTVMDSPTVTDSSDDPTVTEDEDEEQNDALVKELEGVMEDFDEE